MRPLARTFTYLSTAVVVATVAACGSNPNLPPEQVVTSRPYSPAYPPAASASYVEFGRVSSVDIVRTEERGGRPSGAGAVIGGIAGAVVGNQIGGGSGRALATAAGAVGGAVVGNNVEGRNRNSVHETYRVSIQVDNGSVRAYDVPSPGDLRVGDRVRIQDGQISRV